VQGVEEREKRRPERDARGNQVPQERRPGGSHEIYSIFVVDRSGHASEIKEWPATPNKQMRPTGTTPLRVSQIADLEIRQSDTNEVLLRAPLQ